METRVPVSRSTSAQPASGQVPARYSSKSAFGALRSLTNQFRLFVKQLVPFQKQRGQTVSVTVKAY